MTLGWLANFLRFLYRSTVGKFFMWNDDRLRAVAERRANEAWASCWQDEVYDLELMQPDEWHERRAELMREAQAKAFATGAAQSARPMQLSQKMWEDFAKQHEQRIREEAPRLYDEGSRVTLPVESPIEVDVETARAALHGIQDMEETLQRVREFGYPSTVADRFVGIGARPPGDLASIVLNREEVRNEASNQREIRERAQAALDARTGSMSPEVRLMNLCRHVGREFRPDGWPETLRYPANPPAEPLVGALWTEYDEYGCTYHYGFDGVGWVCLENSLTTRGRRAGAAHDTPFTTGVRFSGAQSEIQDFITAQRAGISYEELITDRQRAAEAERNRRSGMVRDFGIRNFGRSPEVTSHEGNSGGFSRAGYLNATTREILTQMSPGRQFVRMMILDSRLTDYARETNYSGYTTYTFFGITVNGHLQCLALSFIQSTLGSRALQLIAEFTEMSVNIEHRPLDETYEITFGTTNLRAASEFAVLMESVFTGGPKQEAVTVPTQELQNESQSARRLNLSHRERKEDNEPHVQHQSDTNPVRRGIAKRRKRDE